MGCCTILQDAENLVKHLKGYKRRQFFHAEVGKEHAHSMKCQCRQVPLLWAAENGKSVAVGLLLENFDPDVKDYQSRTPLLLAVGNGHKDAIKLLLETGKVNLESKSECGQTPLSWAAQNGGEAIIKLLLETGKVNLESKSNSG